MPGSSYIPFLCSGHSSSGEVEGCERGDEERELTDGMGSNERSTGWLFGIKAKKGGRKEKKRKIKKKKKKCD